MQTIEPSGWSARPIQESGNRGMCMYNVGGIPLGRPRGLLQGTYSVAKWRLHTFVSAD